MTRARDLMIFAMPKLDWDDDQWLGITGATDLLPVRNDAGEFEFSAERTLWQFRYCEPASEDQTPTKKDAIALHWFTEAGDRKSTRLNSITNAPLVCRLLLEKKKKKN